MFPQAGWCKSNFLFIIGRTGCDCVSHDNYGGGDIETVMTARLAQRSGARAIQDWFRFTKLYDSKASPLLNLLVIRYSRLCPLSCSTARCCYIQRMHNDRLTSDQSRNRAWTHLAE